VSEVAVDLSEAITGTQVVVRLQSGGEKTVRIPPGAGDGDKVRVAGHGMPGRGGPPGDLLITVKVRPHEHFKRDGLDLELDLPLTPGEAFEGAKVGVPTPDGEVSLKVPAGTQSGQRTRLRGKGVKRQGKVGDLFVRFLIRLPEQPSKKVAMAIEDLDAAISQERPLRRDLSL
jgi:curved DNA-binding protein